jgi:hypothetical protein
MRERSILVVVEFSGAVGVVDTGEIVIGVVGVINDQTGRIGNRGNMRAGVITEGKSVAEGAGDDIKPPASVIIVESGLDCK